MYFGQSAHFDRLQASEIWISKMGNLQKREKGLGEREQLRNCMRAYRTSDKGYENHSDVSKKILNYPSSLN